MWLKCFCRDQLPIHEWPGCTHNDPSFRAIRQRATIGIIGLGLDFSDAISRRVLLDTASLVEGNNVVPLPRVARE